jgi:rod shape-determining protein MreD
VIVSTDYSDQNTLSPANGWYIFATLIGALLLTMLPFQGIFLNLRPDFVALTMLYWSIHQPHRVGMSIAFGMGLLVDVSNAGILGQHAMAYCIITYFALILHRRLRYFNPTQQAPQIGLILLLMQFIILIIGLLSGYRFPGWYFFLASITGMFIWPLVTFSLGILQKPKTDPDAL